MEHTRITTNVPTISQTVPTAPVTSVISILPTFPVSHSFIQKFSSALMYYISILILFSFFLMPFDYTNFSGLEHEKTETNIFKRYFDRLYFVSTTLSSVGYGDIYPTTILVRLIVIVMQSVAAMGVLSLLME